MVNTRNNLSFVHAIVVIVFLSIFVTTFISAQIERRDDLITLIKQHAAWDPAEFVLEKLEANRIVMLGDGGHGDPLYSRLVINSLNKWLTECEQLAPKSKPKTVPSKLFLILEIDSVQTIALKHYFQSGNLIETIEQGNFTGYQFTTGTLEFYFDLRIFRKRVDTFNRNQPESKQVSFDILGPEKVIDLSKWTREMRDSFFVYERDEFSSAKIKDLLNNAPDAKALIYYGEAHLQRENAPKPTDKGQLMGYYIGHYLDESFGSMGGVYTCGQFDVPSSPWLDCSVTKIGKTFAIDHSVFEGVAIGIDAKFPIEDGAVYYFTQSRQTRHISILHSESLIDYILNHIDTYKNGTSIFTKGIIGNWFYYLSNITATDWHPLDYKNVSAVDSTIEAWKEWRRVTKLDIVDDLSSLQYFKRSIDRIRTTTDPQSTRFQMQLAQLVGFKVWFQTGASPQIRADSIWSFINKYRKPIVIENLIHLLWVGSESEYQKAVAILKKETGEKFNTAKEWTTWWESQQSN